MPSNVARFEILYYLSLLVGIPILLLDPNHAMARAGAGFTIFTALFTWAVMILLLWLSARRRKNWARWAILIFSLLGMIPYLFVLVEMFKSSVLPGMLSVLQLTLQLVALYLVFTGNAQAWFAKEPAP